MEIQSKIRIKDIAERAGVSVGTVDRVIHGRTNVSKLSYEKVQKVLEEINYVPNHYASALASNKTYYFAAILPMHEADSYWARVEMGLRDGVSRFSDFKIAFKIFHYDPFNDESFVEEYRALLATNPFAVIIAPIFQQRIMTEFVGALEAESIPYSLIDSNWPEFNPVTFYGQDSKRSGEFSARIMMLASGGVAQRIFIFKILGEGRVASRQQLNRERGFRQYLADNCPKCEIVDVNLYAYDKQGMREIMREAFAENPDVRLGVSFNSSIHLIGDFLRTEMPEHPHVTLLGYDMLEANVRCVKQGFVDFLIAQHPHKQGLNCFRSMFNTCVLHSKPTRDHYVSIELLTKENIDYYED
ncbi:MAG: LacI family DNA-binding transcriptional regulator [Bacteroidaceae bacterium]|jgi:LacI family transcriptional regulator|nr:LacI family DNA-binding transcriptional regulator [Bacteroidaceae bacterium]